MAKLVKDANGLLGYPEDITKPPLDLPPLAERIAEALRHCYETNTTRPRHVRMRAKKEKTNG